VPEEHVTNVLERLREQQTLWQPLEAESTIADADRVVVEITPLEADGPGKARTYQLVLGEGQAAVSIENVIRGLKPGDAGEYTVELADRPDDPSSEVKSHQIHLRVLEAKRPQRPELDDEFAKGVGSFTTMAELRERVQSDLQAEAERDAERQVRTRLVQEIVDANPFDVPSSMIEEYLGRIIPDAEGEDPEQLAEARRQLRPGATDAIRRMLVIDRIAETEALRATPDEVEAKVSEIAERLGRSVADVKARFAKNGRLDELANEITEQKVLDYLMTLSTIE
jgi:trigger factor